MLLERGATNPWRGEISRRGGRGSPKHAGMTPAAKKWLGLAVRVLATAAAFAWIATRVDLAAVGAAVARIPPAAIALATALVAANVVAGALRWRVLQRAYGATRIARAAVLVRLCFVGLFCHT